MPRSARLVAAILFAGLCQFVADAIVRTALPEGLRVGRFREILAAGGLVPGWRIIGRTATGPAGRGAALSHCVTAGLGAAAVLAVLGLVIHGVRAMMGESLELGFDAICEAASARMALVWADAGVVAPLLVLGLLFGGGAVARLAAGVAGRSWR